MSYVTNVLVHGDVEREVGKLNEWLHEVDTERHQQLEPVSFDSAGGTKWYTASVWAAAFNYGPMSELREKLRDPATWGTSVRMVAVVIDGEDGIEAWCFDDAGTPVYRPVTAQEFQP